MYENLIQVVDCLTPQQLDSLLPSVKTLPFQNSTVFTNNDGTLADSSGRTSSGTFVPEGTSICVEIHNAMNASLIEYQRKVGKLCKQYQFYPVIGGVKSKSSREQIQILRYSPGEKYDYHSDTHDYQDRKQFFRSFSVVVYLNDDFEGGGTDFVHRHYKPKAGQALIFPSSWVFTHSGAEVVSGTKYVAVTWYYVTRQDYTNQLPPLL